MANSIDVVKLPASRLSVDPGFLWKVSLIAGLGGILYGYDMGIIAAAMIFVRNTFALSTGMEEATVSVVLVGAMAGAILGGAIADRIGRRATLVWGGIIFIIGSIMAPLAPAVSVLILARAILGLAIGFTSVTAPVYVSELSPPHSRGMMIGLYQLCLTIGIALADLTGYWLAGQQGWRAMFALGLVPAVFFVAMVFSVPESPRWLYAQGRLDDARRVLLTYTNEAGASALLEDIRVSMLVKMERRWSALWSPAVRKALFIAVGFTVLQQVTGINTIIYYGPKIFALAGFTANKHAIFATLLVAIMNVVGTLIALVLVDRVGRKPLLYVGVGGMTASLGVLSYAFYRQPTALGLIATACLMVYITFFAFSMGPIAWILVAEVFPLRLRGRGVAAATLGSGSSNFLVSMTFLSLIHFAGNAVTFGLYGVFCVLTLFFVVFVVPETKGRELESISTERGLVTD